MDQNESSSKIAPELVASPREFFEEIVVQGLSHCRLNPSAVVRNYLIELLEGYMHVESLEDEPDQKTGVKHTTLAERFLVAASLGLPDRVQKLKRVGDTALYISGFFGDSFKRKVVDIDYYAEIGGTAYSTLASHSQSDLQGRVFDDLSRNFMGYVDVLTFVSQEAMIQTDSDLLRLYDRYLSTGSKLAEAQLLSRGVLAVAGLPKGRKQQ